MISGWSPCVSIFAALEWGKAFQYYSWASCQNFALTQWITAWVANCEHRQAEDKYGRPKLYALLQKYQENYAALHPVIEAHVQEFVAKGRLCLAVQVLQIVDNFDPESDSTVA